VKQLVNSTSEPSWPSIEVEFNRPIELFVDNFTGYNSHKDTFKILWIKESEEISKFKSHAIENHKKFDALITYDEDVLNQCDNAYFMEFGTAWISDFDNTAPKKFQISHLTGFKEMTKGHIMRKKVHYKQGKISSPKDFYISRHGGVEDSFGNKHLGDSKNPLFESQFHICIENSQQKNFFTEKLIDCLVTKTIPIFWGCENIEKFFDINGFFIAKDVKDIVKICNSLDENTYQDKLKFIEKNFELSQKYITIIDRLEIVIKEILKDK